MSTYEETALWTVVQEYRERVAVAEKQAKEARSNAQLAEDALTIVQNDEKRWREALLEVLAGQAVVEWDQRSAGSGAYFVRFKEAGKDKMRLPEVKGFYEGKRKTPPRGAAHVGSTNQGKASTHR